VQAEVNDMLERRPIAQSVVTIHKYPAPTTPSPARRQTIRNPSRSGFGTDRDFFKKHLGG